MQDILGNIKKILTNLDHPHTGEIINYDISHPFDENLSTAICTIQDVISRVNPSTILEIGFNRGSSATLFLSLSNANLISVDVVYKEQSVRHLNNLFGSRFTFYQLNSQTDSLSSIAQGVDLVFIDGDHSKKAMLKDAETAISLGAKYILFDDYEHPAHGQDVKTIIQELKLTIIQTYSNQCLCVVK